MFGYIRTKALPVVSMGCLLKFNFWAFCGWPGWLVVDIVGYVGMRPPTRAIDTTAVTLRPCWDPLQSPYQALKLWNVEQCPGPQCQPTFNVKPCCVISHFTGLPYHPFYSRLTSTNLAEYEAAETFEELALGSCTEVKKNQICLFPEKEGKWLVINIHWLRTTGDGGNPPTL